MESTYLITCTIIEYFFYITLIYGPESSGKTTLTLSVIAEAQKQGKTCAFIDAEHALDPSYAEKLGVNIADLLISQPDTGEQALEIVDMLVRSNSVDVIIVDSVAALVPKSEIEGEMGSSSVGVQARLLSQAMRKLTGSIKNANCLVVPLKQRQVVTHLNSTLLYVWIFVVSVL
ncbi:hypothetical protein GCM10011350_37620 [Marinomonas arctica]|nr:hypothetical protein GCM10011350_37620 [Marinomonas arctica]